MKNNKALMLPLVFAAAFVFGCVPKSDAQQVSTKALSANNTGLDVSTGCDSKAIQNYIGKRFTSVLAEKMRKKAGAAIVRTGSKDSPVTMDYNPARLNVFYDDAILIAVINCG